MQLQLFFTCKSKTRSLYNYKNQSGTVYWHLEGCRQSLRLWKGTCGIQIRANEISFRARKMPITASVWRICKIDVTMWDFIVFRKYWTSNIVFPNKAVPYQWVHLVIYLFIHVVILSLTKGLLCHTFPGSTLISSSCGWCSWSWAVHSLHSRTQWPRSNSTYWVCARHCPRPWEQSSEQDRLGSGPHGSSF